MQSKVANVEAYLAEQTPERRQTLEAVRRLMRQNLDARIAEGISYGMIGYFVPHAIFPAGYHCDPKQPLPFAGLAAQKGHFSLYLMGLYLDPELTARFEARWQASGKKLDMGKSCVRFKRLEDLASEAIAETLRGMDLDAYLATYQARYGSTKAGAKALAKAGAPAGAASRSRGTAAPAKPAAPAAPAAKRASPGPQATAAAQGRASAPAKRSAPAQGAAKPSPAKKPSSAKKPKLADRPKPAGQAKSGAKAGPKRRPAGS
jgi:hypothetical protein